MSDDPLFNDQVDLFMLSTMLSIVAFCDFPDEMWALLAERMGGEEAGFTADEVHQHFNKFIKNGELIDGEDGAKVFLGGEALIQHKYDLGEIDAGERDDLINRIDENWVGCEIRKAYFFGDESLQGVSEVKNGVAEEAEDSDE